MIVTQTCKYLGKVQNEGRPLHQIAVSGIGKYKPTPVDQQAGLAFKISKAALKFDQVGGKVLFDDSAGRLHTLNHILKGSGNMTFVIGGSEETVDMALTQSLTTSVHDKLPELPNE